VLPGVLYLLSFIIPDNTIYTYLFLFFTGFDRTIFTSYPEYRPEYENDKKFKHFLGIGFPGNFQGSKNSSVTK
jgi:hypothetical protein